MDNVAQHIHITRIRTHPSAGKNDPVVRGSGISNIRCSLQAMTDEWYCRECCASYTCAHWHALRINTGSSSQLRIPSWMGFTNSYCCQHCSREVTIVVAFLDPKLSLCSPYRQVRDSLSLTARECISRLMPVILARIIRLADWWNTEQDDADLTDGDFESYVQYKLYS